MDMRRPRPSGFFSLENHEVVRFWINEFDLLDQSSMNILEANHRATFLNVNAVEHINRVGALQLNRIGEVYLMNWYQEQLRQCFGDLNRHARLYHFAATNRGQYPVAANPTQLNNFQQFLRDLFLEIYYGNQGLDIFGDALPDRLRYLMLWRFRDDPRRNR